MPLIQLQAGIRKIEKHQKEARCVARVVIFNNGDDAIQLLCNNDIDLHLLTEALHKYCAGFDVLEVA